MRKILTSVLLLSMVICFCNNLNAQSDEPLVNTLNINILSPGIGGEFKIAPKGTIKLDGGIGFGVGFTISSSTGSNSTQFSSSFAIAPVFTSQARYYFNRTKRVDKGKSIYNNSGLFTGASFKYTAPEIYSSKSTITAGNSIDIGPIFGVQRTFNSNIQISLAMGLGYGWDEYNGSRVGFPGTFTLSYMILPKKNK